MATSFEFRAEDKRQDVTIGVSTSMTIISVLIIILRIYTRGVIVRNVGKDDISMTIATFFTVGYQAMLFVLRANGAGLSERRLDVDQKITFFKVTLAVMVVYYTISFLVKTSILLGYIRIAVDNTFHRRCTYTIYTLIMSTIVFIMVTLLQCVPLAKMWDMDNSTNGTCIDRTIFIYFTAGFHILTDIWIIYLPIKTLLTIQRPRREKMALIMIFCLGTFSCLASIIRLNSIHVWTKANDPYYYATPINLYSLIEVNLGIWCASIPAIKALFTQSYKRRHTAFSNISFPQQPYQSQRRNITKCDEDSTCILDKPAELIEDIEMQPVNKPTTTASSAQDYPLQNGEGGMV